MQFRGKGSKVHHKIVRCSASDKIQRIKKFKHLLVEWGVTGFDYKFSRTDLIEEIRRRDAEQQSQFMNQDSTTLGKWINVAIGLLPHEMKEVEELMISYTGLGKGSGLVWEVLEKAEFGRLSAEKKIFCLRAMASKHVYRIKLASKVKHLLKTGTRDSSIPPHSDDGDLHTKWIGSESQELIHHCDYIGDEVRKLLLERNISLEIMTKGRLSFCQWDTCNGIAGILSKLYEDVPGPKSKRKPKHDPSTHLRRIISCLTGAFPDKKKDEELDFSLEEETTDSVKIVSDTADAIQHDFEKSSDGSLKSLNESLNESSSNSLPKNVSEELSPQKHCEPRAVMASAKAVTAVPLLRRSKRNHVIEEACREVRRRASQPHPAINRFDDQQIRKETFALEPNLNKNGEIHRNFSKLSPRYPINLEGKKPRNPMPRTPPTPSPHSATPSLSPSRGSVNSRLNALPVINNAASKDDEALSEVEEDILASGHASHRPQKYSSKFTKNVEIRGDQLRSLVDLDVEDSAGSSYPEQSQIEEEHVLDKVILHHQRKVKEMVTALGTY